MRLSMLVCLLLVAFGVGSANDETTPVFHSDVAMGRIDTQVMDRSQHPIGGLRKEDFVLRQGGKPIQIANLAHEDLPVDVLLLLDVSGSMQVHVQKVASAAHEAMAILGDQDRVGIMVFTTHTRLRLPFKQDLNAVERKLDDVVQSETFNGGTNINGALLDAAAYVEKEGRPQVRHAIVIVTDDQAPACDQARIGVALDRAGAVLMVLLAPTMPVLTGPSGRRGTGVGQPPISSPWPGASGPLGGIILGRPRIPSGIPTSGSPPVMVGYPGEPSAGSPTIARASGGDSLNVNDASSVETTFDRIRRRYALYFYLPGDASDGQSMELDLTNTARRRHPDAVLQYRQIALAKDGAKPGLITRVPAHPPTGRDPDPQEPEASEASPAPMHRRVGVNDSGGGQVVFVAPPAIAQPDSTDQPQTTVRRRGVSESSGGPQVVIGPPR